MVNHLGRTWCSPGFWHQCFHTAIIPSTLPHSPEWALPAAEMKDPVPFQQDVPLSSIPPQSQCQRVWTKSQKCCPSSSYFTVKQWMMCPTFKSYAIGVPLIKRKPFMEILGWQNSFFGHSRVPLRNWTYITNSFLQNVRWSPSIWLRSPFIFTLKLFLHFNSF